ncbi:MAG: ribulose bisphosphate carboxylase small subunit [Phormidesmis sp.]
MVAQSLAREAATSRLGRSAHPQVHPSAEVHEFSFIEGDVRLSAGVTIAPGTAVTAGAEALVMVGEGCSLLPGVVVEGLGGAQVVSANGLACAVWLGDRTVIAHKSVVHSPAFIGQDCFVGFRSTVFNARLGNGCVVMMHALVQDVEVPPGKYIASGSVITSQHQADQLPNVRSEDLEFAKEITGTVAQGANSSRSSQTTSSKARLTPINSYSNSSSDGRSSGSWASNSSQYPTSHSSSATEGSTMQTTPMQTQRLSPEIVQQVRQFLGQGYRIGMEHADKRRYRSGVWETCTPIKETREQAVFAALERCLAEHSGEYVRMFGIDPQVKRRVGMTTVQRPDSKQGSFDKRSGSSASSNNGGGSYRQSSHNGDNTGGGLTADVVQQVRNLLRSGHIIGTEHADARRYRSNVWKSCSPIRSTNEQEVLAHLDHCLAEHSGEYVRMFGIDPKAKRRMSSVTIQRADGKPVDASGTSTNAQSSSRQSYGSSQAGGYSQSSGSGGDNGAVAQAVNQILGQGNQIGIEYADARRYRSGIWQTAPSVQSLNQLQGFLSQHADKYVRVFGVNKAQKTRGAAQTVQKPGQKQEIQPSEPNGSQGRRDPINANPPHYDDPAFRGQPSSYSSSSYSSDRAGGGMDNSVMEQVTQLVNQGHKISIEYADKRRYRSGIWKTGVAINARRPAEAISALGKQLAQHRDDYVKLVGIDTKAKRRVVETTIQKPGQGVSGTGPDPINANPPHYDDPAYRGQPSSYSSNSYSSDRAGGGYGYGSNSGSNGNNGSSGGMESKVMDQVTQLVNQGHRISVEYADKRRYRSGIWKTGEAIDARRPAEAISALGKQLAQHQGEYVRLVGVDPQAKRRVLEATIQRP